MRLAILSDIHGNLHALDAVLADMAELGTFDKVWVLGDLCAFGTRPKDCLERLYALRTHYGEKHVQFIGGNTDRYLVTGERLKLQTVTDSESLEKRKTFTMQRDAVLNWGVEQLEYADYAFLSGIIGRELALEVAHYGAVIGFHAIPSSDEPMSLRPDSPEEEALDSLLDRAGRLAVCGHTHLKMDRTLKQWRVINVGSVGLSFSQAGMAEWGYITFEGGNATLTQRVLEYNVNAVLEDAEQVGYPAPSLLQNWLK